MENVRTALEHGAAHVTVIGRRHGTICPKALRACSEGQVLGALGGSGREEGSGLRGCGAVCFSGFRLPLRA